MRLAVRSDSNRLRRLLDKDFRATLKNMRNVRLGTVLCLMLSMTSFSLAQSTQTAASRKFDEFSAFNCEEVKARLDNFAISLLHEPNSKGYIIVYGGRREWRGEARAWINLAKEYLSNVRPIAAERITVVNGGYRKLLTMELWLLPTGENPPVATPTVQPKDVRFKRGRAPKHICGEE